MHNAVSTPTNDIVKHLPLAQKGSIFLFLLLSWSASLVILKTGWMETVSPFGSLMRTIILFTISMILGAHILKSVYHLKVLHKPQNLPSIMKGIPLYLISLLFHINCLPKSSSLADCLVAQAVLKA
jgi:hypothetical protein